MGSHTNPTVGTRARERMLGNLLFDRYPHLVPSAHHMQRLTTLIGGLEEQERALEWLAQASPMGVLEAWFDRWATLAFREWGCATEAGSECDCQPC